MHLRLGLWVYMFSLVVLFSCSQQYPKDVLPPEKMKFVFFDMMLADEFQIYFAAKDSTANSDSIRFQHYSDILRLHKIDSSLFKRSLDFYKKDIEAFSVLIDSVSQYADREREKRFQLKARVDSLAAVSDSSGN